MADEKAKGEATKPKLAYDLATAQKLVRHSIETSSKRHTRWRILERLFRYGKVESVLQELASPTTVNLFREYASPLLDSINLVLPHTTIIINSVVSEDPQLRCTPVGGTPDAEARSKAAEQVLTQAWLQADATTNLKRSVADMVKLGIGFVKVGFNHAEADVELTDDELADKLHQAIKDDLHIVTTLGVKPTPSDELLKQIETTRSVTVHHQAYAEYVSPYDMFVPTDARRLDEARWVAQRLVVPKDELEANPAYETDNIQASLVTSASETVRRDDGWETGDGVSEYCEIFQFYDQRSRRLMVFQLNSGEALYDGELPDGYQQGSPFVDVRNYEASGDEFWPFGDLDNVAALAHMLNEAFTEQMDNMRRAGNMYIARESHITHETREAIENGDPNTLVIVGDEVPMSMELQHVIVPLEKKGLDADIYQAISGLQQHMADVMGINEFQRGGSGTDRMAATTAALIDGTASTRAMEKRASVERAARKIGQLILWQCQAWMSPSEWVRIAGNNGAGWVQLGPEDLEGTFRVNVVGGTLSAVNAATQAQKGMQLMQVFLPAITQMGYDPDPWLRQALELTGYSSELLEKAQQPAQDPSQGGGQPPVPGDDSAGSPQQPDPANGKPAPGQTTPVGQIDPATGRPVMPDTSAMPVQAGAPPMPAEAHGGLALH